MHATGRFRPLAAAVLASLALSGCAMSVTSFAARGVDFAQYRTYAWAPDIQLQTGDPRLDNNPFFLARMRAAVERELGARGYEKVAADEAALAIHFHASVTQRLDLTDADPGPRGECRGCGPYVYDEGSLVLDLVDPKTELLVWRGWAEGSIDGLVNRQDRMEEAVDRAVARILETLPRSL